MAHHQTADSQPQPYQSQPPPSSSSDEAALKLRKDKESARRRAKEKAALYIKEAAEFAAAEKVRVRDEKAAKKRNHLLKARKKAIKQAYDQAVAEEQMQRERTDNARAYNLKSRNREADKRRRMKTASLELIEGTSTRLSVQNLAIAVGKPLKHTTADGGLGAKKKKIKDDGGLGLKTGRLPPIRGGGWRVINCGIPDSSNTLKELEKGMKQLQRKTVYAIAEKKIEVASNGLHRPPRDGGLPKVSASQFNQFFLTDQERDDLDFLLLSPVKPSVFMASFDYGE
jgi:hypothetical protein